MIRTLVFLLKLTLLVAAAVWLANRPGEVVLSWLGYEVRTSMGVLLLALVLVIVLAVIVHALWRAVLGLPQAFSAGHLSRRQHKGYTALTEGLLAVASGDAKGAQKLARKAQKYLEQPTLPLLLQAQAAQLAGDEVGVATYYTQMLQQPELAFMGLRGLIAAARRRGDKPGALALARRAQVQQPKAVWVLAELVELEAENGNWQVALDTLARAERGKAVTAARAKSLRPALLTALAQQSGSLASARPWLEKALHEQPGFLPAAQFLASQLLSAGESKPASKVIERCWRVSQSSELGALYLQAGGELVGAALLRRAEQLASYNPHAPISIALVAHAALQAQLWGVARGTLSLLPEAQLTQPLALLWAELEEKQHHDTSKAEHWRNRATTLPAAPEWACNSCGAHPGLWQPVCRSCGSLGTLALQTPAAAPSAPLALAAPAPLALPVAQTAKN